MHGTSGHQLVGNEAIVFDGIQHITERTTLREGYIAMGADSGLGTIEIGLVNDVHFGEVVLGLAHAEQLGLKECQGAITPASTSLILVFHGGDWKFLNGSELEAFFFLGFLVFSLRLGNDADAEHQSGCSK